MPSLRTRDLERNEVAWWSNWATVTWLGENTWVMTSEYFDEYFLNRGGFLECEGVGRHIRKAEELLVKRGATPCFFVQESCKANLRRLGAEGYLPKDGMAVMTLDDAALRVNEEVRVGKVRHRDIGEWVSAYLLSFYGNLNLSAGVTDVVRRLENTNRVTLLTGRVRGRVAGVIALSRSPGLLGVYCVGTVPEFRRIGVTATLLDSARKLASSEGRRAILQTIQSDGYERYYTERGFRKVYAKTLLWKSPAGTAPVQREG